MQWRREAVICLAEGWSTAEPPTAKMLANSYYAKAFKKVRAGKLTWNWAAAFGGVFWPMYHKMYMIGLLFTLCCT
ncbi:MAG: DUF2628 domain-containing protein [Holosporales bacterium]|jgi:hypothetical protein|nr:DUF2628 domain-containing protein [Holosporales bacterium]